MKVTPLNVVLALVLAVLVGADAALDDGGVRERAIERLFPDLYGDRVARFVLERGDELVECRRREDGRFVLPAHFDHPANETTVRLLLSALTSLTTLDLVTEDAARHGEYGVGDGALTVRGWDERGELVVGLVQGAEAPAGDASYVRRAGSDAVYRAPRLRGIPLDARLWLDAEWMPFAEALVDEVRLAGAALDEPLVLEREAGTVDRWRAAGGEPFPASRVRDFVSRVRSLFFEEVVAARAADLELGEPALSITLGTVDGKELRASFHADAAAGDGSVLATHGPEDFVVRFPAAAWESVRAGAEGLGR